MIRIFFKDGAYLDLSDKEEVEHWEMQPDWDRTEDLDESDSDEDEVPL